MKQTFGVILAIIFLLTLSGCKNKDKTGSSSPERTLSKETSYALGMDVGTSLKAEMLDLSPDVEEFTQGIKDILNDSKTRYTKDEAYQILVEAFSAISERIETETRQAEVDFLAENSKKPGIIITGSGLQYEIISEGNGPKPSYDSVVQVHYEGELTDGTIFDSSYPGGEPVELSLYQVIPGWAEGLQLMGIGSKYRFYIPSDLGYGPQGRSPQIPPYATLVFEIELLGINSQNQTN